MNASIAPVPATRPRRSTTKAESARPLGAATAKDRPRHELNPSQWSVEYRDYLVNFARSRVGDHAQAEDLVQETFLSAWKGRRGFRGDCTERTWLTGVLRNKIVDHYRASARRPLVREADVALNDDRSLAESWMEAQPAVSAESDPRDATQQREFMRTLEQALTRIPEMAGRAFRMREIQGCSTEEITRTLNISKGNLWVLIHRAKQALRSQLELSWG